MQNAGEDASFCYCLASNVMSLRISHLICFSASFTTCSTGREEYSYRICNTTF